jgi:hypothetical protein
VSYARIGVSTEEAKAELQAVLESSGFVRSPRLSRLLVFLCSKYLAGEADQIKEYSIGVEVLGRPESFDPANDAAARVEVHRLRRKLQQFYESEGASRKLRIVIPVGHYVPAFVPNVIKDVGMGEHGTVGMAADSPAPPNGVNGASESSNRVPLSLVADIVAREPKSPAGLRFSPPLVALGALTVLTLLFVVTQIAGRLRASAPTGHSIMPAALFSGSRPLSGGMALPGNPVRLACGRSVSYTDRTGQTWDPDRYFDGGKTFDSPRQFFFRAADSKLYQAGRIGDFSYHIPLPKGVYELKLGFAESMLGPGTADAGQGEYGRTFDVKANGRLILDDFDIYSDADGSNVADIRVFKDISPSSDGMLHLDFHSRRGPALVNFIELAPAEPHRLNPIRIVAQENFVTGANGVVWSPDMYFIGGQLSLHQVQVSHTDDADLYTRERFGHFEYAIPVDAGTYGLSLHFAEEYFGTGNAGGFGVGARTFDVFCNGVALLRNFDILKEASPNQALVKTFHGLKANAQGKLVVTFVPVHNYASIYALEVADEGE